MVLRIKRKKKIKIFSFISAASSILKYLSVMPYQLLSFWYCSLCRTSATSSEHYRLSPGINQEGICEEGCCLSDAHFTHCRTLKLCSECGRGLQGRQGGAKALLFSELNTSLAISSQTCLFHRMPVKYKAFHSNLTFHPFRLTVSLFSCACFISKVWLGEFFPFLL